MSAPQRYEAIDRQHGQASSLTRWSAINPRYFIRDTTTGQIVDEFVSVKAARETARDLNNNEG
jgi:hypothetical protein